MHPDSFEDKMKELLGSMDESDAAAAMARKEKIWAAVVPPKKNPGKKWWPLLLLIPLGFVAGWFLKPSPQLPDQTPHKIETTTPIVDHSDMNYKQALANTNEQLSITQRSLDSMRMAYTDLVNEMEAYRAELRQGSMASIKTIYERDTIYVTQKEVEQRIVEKIVRDTVIIEIPMDGFAPLMTEAEASNSAVLEESDQGKNKKEKRSSIQFNFSESKSFR